MEEGSNTRFTPGSLENAYQQALDKTSIVAITDAQGRITYVNDKFCEISEYAREELIGKNHNILKSGYHDRDFYKDLWGTIKKGEVWMGQIKNKTKHGGSYWVQTTIVPMMGEDNQPLQYLSFRIDITAQKMSEEKLEKSWKQLNILAENFPNGSVSLIDPELNLLLTGGAGYDAVDFAPEDVIGKTLDSVLSPQTYAYIKEHLPRILRGETITHEIYARNRHYMNTYKPVYDEGGVLYGFVMVVIDVSESKKASLILKRNNELFAIGEELAQIGSWNVNASTREIIFSSNTLRLLGQDPCRTNRSFEEVFQWIHPDDRHSLADGFREIVSQKILEFPEFRVIKPDGEERVFKSLCKKDLSSNDDEIHVFGVLKDITDRKKKELELLESKEILSNIADSIPGLVMRYVEYGKEEAKIQYVSKGAEMLWEVPKEKILLDVSIVWNKVHQDDLPGFLKSFSKARSTQTVWNCEFRIVMDDGRVKWVNAIGTPKKVQGQGVLWDILALDVSARKLAEENIEKNLRLVTFQNTQLLDFCNIVSHNLRSPLVNMSMLIGFIEESEDESERMEYVAKLKPVIEGLNETFEELVESIQIQQDNEVKSEYIDVEECLRKIISGFEGQIAHSNALIETDFSQVPVLYYPPKYLSSILHNLISNALKYHSPNRRLKVKIKMSRLSHKVLLTITDNGLGIDLKKHQNNLFKIRKVFHRHPDAKGFGLYITKAQVDAMKGRIWAESIPDKGSTFFVEFNNQ